MDKIMTRILMWFIALAFAFNVKAENVFPENVVIETDRDIYIAGEDLYFSIFINNGPSNKCYIVLRNEKNTFLKFYVNTKNNGTYSSFYLPDTLKTGYYEIVAYTNYMRNFGEEAYFRKQLIVVNRFDEWLSELKSENTSEIEDIISKAGNNPEMIMLKTFKDTFGIREKVNLEVETTLPLKNISITIKENNPFSSNLLKQSNSSPPSPKNSGELKYKPETKGIHLYGKLTNGNAPVENECLFISTPDTFPNLQYTFTNKNGEFSFILSDYYPGKPAIISTRENYQGKYTITLEDKFSLSQPFVPDKRPFNASLKKYIFESQNIAKVRKAYNVNHSQKEDQIYDIQHIPYVYHESTQVVFPSQFIVLNNFEEIVNNLLTGFRIKSKDGISRGYNQNPSTGILFENPGALFLNGIYVYNLNNMMNFTSSDITKIELCNDNRLKGRIQFQGIISVNTSKAIDYAAILPGSLITGLSKPLPPIAYAPPRYESISTWDPMPDFRQTLYWNNITELNGTKTFNFYTSDWPANYIVEIKATTPGGNRVSSFKIINVRK